MSQGTYSFLVEHVSGGQAVIDFVRFEVADSPVEPTSWGSIKGLYR